MPLIPVVERLEQVDLCEFKASLVYKASSRTVRATQRNPVPKNNNKVATDLPYDQVIWLVLMSTCH